MKRFWQNSIDSFLELIKVHANANLRRCTGQEPTEIERRIGRRRACTVGGSNRKGASMNPNEIGDDDPVSLAVAAKVFLHGQVTKSALRTEAAKGKLEILKIANKDFVTRSGIRAMLERCKVPPKQKTQPITMESANRALDAMLSSSGAVRLATAHGKRGGPKA